MRTKMKKRIIIGIAAFAGLILIGGIVLLLSLGGIVKAGITTVVPKITGTPVSIKTLGINPLAGSLHIEDFIIGNPEGFVSPHAFKLDEMKISLKLSSIFSDKIMVDEILVDGMEVIYETKLSTSNIGTIKRNIDNFAKKEDRPEKKKPAPEEPEEEKPEAKKKRIVIDQLTFSNASVRVNLSILKKAAETGIKMPDIRLTGIGRESDSGTTIADAAEEIILALYPAIMDAVKGVGSMSTKDLEESVDGIIKDVKKLF